MRAAQVTGVLGFAAQAVAHGYIYRVTADNTVYPGWDINLDPRITPTPARIAYGGGTTFPVTDANSPAIACNTVHNPAPGAIAEVRAGSDVTFHWSRWLYSHKGPLTAWMAPYEGDIADVNVNDLEFFKFGEETIDENGVWGTVKMLDDTNGTWTATIPADIKPGNYIIRQEIIALHFAVATPDNLAFFQTGPQFYMTCFNFKVMGDGDATPQGTKFPGAYDMSAPGLNWNLNSTEPYPVDGPALYKSEYTVDLEPKEQVVISPTGNGEEADAVYFEQQYAVLKAQGETTAYFDSIGG
ncbi:uncharacterized protein DNG_09006 [Cephalotrichum gorgonifer]|uniref:lytic cellulose monooxygenase (C4-dehydrogenating) n=1 Tax=Cephalotrichum gorgonifer TaxID=2041049 RepID=A0AAE8SZS0_9PEZI|nr:uncharacterized protein DNG_09006 [Cephalotrichum gorgonifer]